MIATVDAEQGRSLALLEKLVNQNSGSLNLDGVEAVGRMVRTEFEPLGFAVRWIPLRQTGRAGHLIAHHRGKAGVRKLLLIGHLDTVFELDLPFQKWRRKGNDGHGPGASDNKGGVVTMIAALRAMKADIGIGLADTLERGPAVRDAGAPSDRPLAPRHDVGPEAACGHLRHDLRDVVGLDRVLADPRVREGLADRRRGPVERARSVT